MLAFSIVVLSARHGAQASEQHDPNTVVKCIVAFPTLQPGLIYKGNTMRSQSILGLQEIYDQIRPVQQANEESKPQKFW